MQNFRFNAYTDIHFGEGQIKELPSIIKKHGKNVLLVYGYGSIKKLGLYDEIKSLLKDCDIVELSGVDPNPRITSVRKGVELCRENDVDVVLAVGGGSVIDCAKVIAAGVFYEKDAWDLVTNPSLIGKVLPIVSVLTLAATGSEMNKNAVISNMDTNEKLGTSSNDMIPQASICDPTYLYTLPAIQTAAGTADIMSHIFESYFDTAEGNFVQDRFAEGLLQTCIKYCPIALDDPKNYEARANLMWASTLALNGLLGSSRQNAWTVHPIEHELGAYYDITHGTGLAIVTPRWMRYILSDSTVDKFVEFARNVWGLSDDGDKFALANAAIDKTEEFFVSCKIPMTLTELGIDKAKFEIMAEKAVKFGNLEYAYVPLTKEDVVKIFEMCV